jgi:hypothetical protein
VSLGARKVVTFHQARLAEMEKWPGHPALEGCSVHSLRGLDLLAVRGVLYLKLIHGSWACGGENDKSIDDNVIQP